MNTLHRSYAALLAIALLATTACAPSPPATTSEDTHGDTIPVQVDQNTTDAASACGIDDAPAPLSLPERLPAFEAFNFRTTRHEVMDNTLVFENARYRFIFCRPTRTWFAESLMPADEAVLGDYRAYDEPPPYEAIALDGNTYEARVRLAVDWANSAEPPAVVPVVFDLIAPGTEAPTSITLYDSQDIQAKEYGADAGVPHISRSVAHDGSLWWAIGFEMGEGFSGVTTIVQYDPAVEAGDGLTLWQSDELGAVQINDMIVTGSGDDLTLWLGTQYAGEGNPYLPALGLVAYRPREDRFTHYTPTNSPLVGVIPTQLVRMNDSLWAATGSGACEIPIQETNLFKRWNCWQFTVQAELPEAGSGAGLELYSSLLAETPATTVSGETVEVLWAATTEPPRETLTNTPMRYEVRYEDGFEAALDNGAQRYQAGTLYDDTDPPNLYWPGQPWQWNGVRFVRSHDAVSESRFGGGPFGLGPNDWNGFINNWYTMRGNLDLLALTETETQIRYYAGWVEADQLSPYIAFEPTEWTREKEKNPLVKIREELTPINPFE